MKGSQIENAVLSESSSQSCHNGLCPLSPSELHLWSGVLLSSPKMAIPSHWTINQHDLWDTWASSLIKESSPFYSPIFILFFCNQKWCWTMEDKSYIPRWVDQAFWMMLSLRIFLFKTFISLSGSSNLEFWRNKTFVSCFKLGSFPNI